MSARDALAAYIGYEPGERDVRFEQLLNAVEAGALRKAATIGGELSRHGYSAQEIGQRLDRMADATEKGAAS